MGRGDRLGGADRTPSSDRRRLGFDAGFGLSVFALQFAQLLGARVIATTSTAEKAERLKVLGPPR